MLNVCVGGKSIDEALNDDTKMQIEARHRNENDRAACTIQKISSQIFPVPTNEVMPENMFIDTVPLESRMQIESTESNISFKINESSYLTNPRFSPNLECDLSTTYEEQGCRLVDTDDMHINDIFHNQNASFADVSQIPIPSKTIFEENVRLRCPPIVIMATQSSMG